VVSRRALLGAGALAALAAAGCGDRTPAKPAGGDAAVLGTLAAIERALSRAWASSTAAQRDDVLPRLRAHTRALAAAGATYDADVPASVASAAEAGGSPEALLSLEQAAAAAYLTQVPGVRDPAARALATGLYAAGAQRVSVLLAALGRDPLPDAFAGTLT
jgi:hypothetical protein